MWDVWNEVSIGASFPMVQRPSHNHQGFCSWSQHSFTSQAFPFRNQHVNNLNKKVFVFVFFSKPHVSQFKLKGTLRCAVSMLKRWGLSQNAINPGPDGCQDTQREPHPSRLLRIKHVMTHFTILFLGSFPKKLFPTTIYFFYRTPHSSLPFSLCEDSRLLSFPSGNSSVITNSTIIITSELNIPIILWPQMKTWSLVWKASDLEPSHIETA